MTELTVLAQGRWPDTGDFELPQLAGFVVSSFNPLAAEAAERCLRGAFGEPPAPPEVGVSTAVIVVSASGDAKSARHVARTVDAGGRVGPLMFFQSVPNSVAGHVAARWGLGGPVVCLSPVGEPLADGLAQAELVISDGDATTALVVLVEEPDEPGHEASATAVLVSEGARP